MSPETLESGLEAGASLQRAERLDEALRCYAQLRERHPESGEPDFRIAVVLAQLGDTAAAAQSLHRALAFRETAAYRFLEADLLERQGDLAGTIGALRRAVAVDPSFAPGHARLAVLLQDAGRLEEAIAHFVLAAQLRPRQARAWSNLAAALSHAGHAKQAEGAARQAVDLEPANGWAHFNLGRALLALGRVDEGRAALEEALRHDARNAQAWDALATSWLHEGVLTRAGECLERATSSDPTLGAAWVRLASVHLHLGRSERAAQALGHAEALGGADAAQIGSARLLALQYDSALSRDAIFEAHREWASRHAPSSAPVAFPNARDPNRRLRVGYLSPRFHRSSLAFLLEPVLRRHDPDAIEVYCYASQELDDDLTRSLRESARAWIDVRKLDDAGLAERMRADAIDVAVDLAGHTPGNRLPAFARRPAPVCITWLDYFNTTGVPSMDYLLTDAVHSPPGDAQPFTESLVRLPRVRLCYQPPELAPAVMPPPLARGARAPVFASFNRMAKISRATLEAWRLALDRVPGATLVVKNSALNRIEDHGHFAAWFSERGIDPRRVEWRPFSAHAQALAEYGEVDIVLDTFPYNGGLTTLEALWMGRPVVTIRGDTLLSRQSAALLCALDADDLVAGDAAGFARIAAELASDGARLAERCAGLRPRMRASALLDAAGFVRVLESTYRDLWKRWLDARGER